VREALGLNFQTVKHALVDGLEVALALGETEKAEELFALAEGPSRSPFLATHARRLRARVAGDAAGLEDAARRFRELELPFYLAVTLLEHAELTGEEGSRAEAREIFERLGARPWLERATARVEVVAS
jgi:hypothetical protein